MAFPRWTPDHAIESFVDKAGTDIGHGLSDFGQTVNSALTGSNKQGLAHPLDPANIPTTRTAENTAPRPPVPAGQPTPFAATTSAPDQLSFQAAVSTAVAPLMKQLGQIGNANNINHALAQSPFSSNANAAEPTLAHSISTSLQTQVKDYQSGLQAMLNNVSTAQPLTDLTKGIGELISYPIALPGQNSAPAAVASSNILDTLYNTLNNMRNFGTGTAPATTSSSPGSSSSDYNQSVANLVSNQ